MELPLEQRVWSRLKEELGLSNGDRFLIRRIFEEFPPEISEEEAIFRCKEELGEPREYKPANKETCEAYLTNKEIIPVTTRLIGEVERKTTGATAHRTTSIKTAIWGIEERARNNGWIRWCDVENKQTIADITDILNTYQISLYTL